MGVLEEVLKNKEEILVKLMEILEGKEATTRISLDGVQFNIGGATVRLDGAIELTLVASSKK
jgi:hypothetical protein